MRHSLFLILTATMFLSCGIKEISINFPEEEAVPVLNGIFKNDSLISIKLSTTQPVLEGFDTEIREASVELYENGEFLQVLNYEDGAFRSEIRPIEKNIYAVSIQIPDFKVIIAEDVQPGEVEVLNVSFRDSAYTGDEGDLYSQLELTISDPPGEDNYYELILKQKFTGTPNSGEIIAQYPLYDYAFNDLVLINEGQLALSQFAHPVFSDELFDGQDYALKVNYFPSYNIFDEEGANLNYDLIVVLRSTSKNYYDFKKSLLLHLESQYSDVWDGVPLPEEMFTNVNGGFGIFAGYVQVSDTIPKR